LENEGRRGFTPRFKNLQAYQFDILEPREAKCCQAWFDKIEDPNDRFEDIGVEKLCTIRNLHAVINSLKRMRCIKCNRETPGLDHNYSQLKVLEKGNKRS